MLVVNSQARREGGRKRSHTQAHTPSVANLSVAISLPISYAFAVSDGKVQFPACFFISSALDDATGRRVGGFGLSLCCLCLCALTLLQHVSVELEPEADSAIRRRSRWG